MIFKTAWHLLFTVAAPLFLKSLLTKWLLQVYIFWFNGSVLQHSVRSPFPGVGSVMFPAMGIAAALRHPLPAQGYSSNLPPIARAVRKNERLILAGGTFPTNLLFKVPGPFAFTNHQYNKWEFRAGRNRQMFRQVTALLKLDIGVKSRGSNNQSLFLMSPLHCSSVDPPISLTSKYT